MVIVHASIRVKKGKIEEFLKQFKAFAVKVRKEQGCIEYFPAVDFQPKLPPQVVDENIVTIIEKWESMKALNVHLISPAMQEHQKNEKDLVEEASIKILKEA
jgi:quinol monooxygenase YgiN